MAAQDQQPTLVEHIGQSVEAELQKLAKPNLGPQTEFPPWIDAVEPFRPLEPAQPPTIQPPATQPPSDQQLPRTTPPKDRAAPMDQTPDKDKDQTPPAQETPPAPVSQPDDADAPPAAGVPSPHAMGPSMNAHSSLAALFGVVAVGGGGYHLAMGESKRFGMPWLPRRVASPRSARPRTHAR